MTIIHCHFVPHQNKRINQTTGFQRNHSPDHYTQLLKWTKKKLLI